jgi:hypothetical protein
MPGTTQLQVSLEAVDRWSDGNGGLAVRFLAIG